MYCTFGRWSHDGKYFARLSTDRLSVYETSVSDHMINGVCVLLGYDLTEAAC